PREGDQKAGDDSGVEPVLGRHATGDGEGHGEGNGDDADGEAGEQIPPQPLPPIGLRQAALSHGMAYTQGKQMRSMWHGSPSPWLWFDTEDNMRICETFNVNDINIDPLFS